MPRKIKAAKLGRSTLEGLNFRFTFEAFVALAPYGVNPMRPATYASFPPKVGVAFVWAGQLHYNKPLPYEAVMAMMPTDTDQYYALMEKVAHALKQAIGVKDNVSAKSE